MHEGSIPLIVKTGHCEGLYRIKLLSCSYAMRSLTLEIRSTSLHRIERPPKKAMTHICKRDAPPSGFVLDGGRDKISHVHSGDESFLSGTLLADREYLLTSASLWDTALPQKPISALSRAFWTRQGQLVMVRITYHVYQVRL